MSWKDSHSTSTATLSAFPRHLQEKLGFFRQKEDVIKKLAYLIAALETALWASCTSETFNKGASKVVKLSDDTDTVGDVYCGLAGARYGLKDIPRVWMSGLQAKSKDTVGLQYLLSTRISFFLHAHINIFISEIPSLP